LPKPMSPLSVLAFKRKKTAQDPAPHESSADKKMAYGFRKPLLLW
jgi:hypothetical protein